MDTMNRSPALNPASSPFFPGGAGHSKDEDNRESGFNYRANHAREQYSTTSSSLSVSPSEFRSVRSSPSPAEERTDRSDYHSLSEVARQSPSLGGGEPGRGFSSVQRSLGRKSSMTAIIETPADGEETIGPHNVPLMPSSYYSSMIGRVRDRLNTPPVTLDNTSRTSSYNSAPNHFMSSSPASSMDSGSMLPSGMDFSTTFEMQLRASPFMGEVLERLTVLEEVTQKILEVLTNKMDLLMERSMSTNGNGAGAPPEFRDPFARSSTPSFVPPGMNGLNMPRGSVVNIAPNQAAPPDDISDISHRLNSLSTSVDQLLAISTHGFQPGTPGLQGPTQNDILASQRMSVQLPRGNMGHNVPNRPDLRQPARMPGPPMRTWSAGTLDLPPMRTAEQTGSMGRAAADAIFRDKRRSVNANMMRRDSAVTDVSSRESGPVISKWEQLALAPELLRSLASFGMGPPNKIQQRALPFLLRGSDIIAQAPPTQERIAAYVIPALHIALTSIPIRGPLRGPVGIIISTTVDQATQAQRMIRDLGSPIGLRSALGVGAANSDLSNELRLLQQNMPHIICGTPQKLHALFNAPGGISGSEVRFLVLDEVDQLIARNLHDYVFQIVKLFPPPRSRPIPSTAGSGASALYSLFEGNGSSSSLNLPNANNGRRFSSIAASPPTEVPPNGTPPPIERQTALFSNTVPQDVLNLATAIQLREPVRVLVRRDGNVTQADTAQGARGLRQFYLYLAFTAGGSRSDAPLPTGGLGIIGSGRGTTNTETVQAREWKLDALVDLFDDLDIMHAIIHVGGATALDAVVYKLVSHGLDAIPLNGDMNAAAKLAALNKFRSPAAGMMRQPTIKILVVYDVPVKAPDVGQVPLIINYDLPKAVEEYAHRVAPAIAPSYSRAGVVVNFVTATGGDVEMLRSIECFYKIKCPEVPTSLRDIV